MNTKRTSLVLLLAAVFLLAGIALIGGAAPAAAAPAAQSGGSVLDVLQNDPQLDEFEKLIEAVGLADNLDKDGPFTVFAPTDAAMAAFEALRADSNATITETALYHIANGRYSSTALADRPQLTTLLGEPVTITVRRGGIILNAEDEHPVTLTMTDIVADNGVVHIIDGVLVPPVNSLLMATKGDPAGTLADVLAADGRFTSLLSLAETAGMADALADAGRHYTLFAPTDAAFANLSAEQMNKLQDPREAAILLEYHLVGDELGINQIATDDMIPTVDGRPLYVTTDKSMNVSLNGHPLVDFNILATNGVIHVVDTVLMP
jgi:uncharacterized surface protein with fasciclin (FAS1) repeats